MDKQEARVINDLMRRVEFLETLERGFGVVPACVVYNNANQGIGSGAWAGITYNTELTDTDNMHTAISPGLITFNTPGIYAVGLQIEFAANLAGQRFGRILDSAGIQIALGGSNTVAGGFGTPLPLIATIRYFQSGQWVSSEAYQNSGGALNVVFVVGAISTPVFWAVRVG